MEESSYDEEKIKHLEERAAHLVALMGYPDSSAQFIREKSRLSLLINDPTGKPLRVRDELRESLEHVVKQIAYSRGIYPVHVDINNFHAHREQLIIRLAKASARKTLITEKPVELPPMNSYERRLVHVELATRPDVQTESVGEGNERRVVVRPFE